jgi:hypothetical protein
MLPLSLSMKKPGFIRTAFLLLCTLPVISLYAQPITGVWKGRIDHKNVEVKIIQKGDSLTGTSYYYQPGGGYKRYSIKGYFNPEDNSVVWWDDQLLKGNEGKRLFGTGPVPLLSVADFNCPGGGKMLLEGKAVAKETPQNTKGAVNLSKTDHTSFPDEWDYVIDNYTNGTNDPYLIDSIALVAQAPRRSEPERPVIGETVPEPVPSPQKPGMTTIPAPPVAKKEPPVTPPLTIQEMYTTRKKIFSAEIPVTGETIELRFYDNAEIDGDSISLFLNDVLIFRHIRLTANAYSVKLSVKDLKATNELTMVAENLGSIPPNTSLMIAMVDNKRYEARLASTENSSAVIRLIKSNHN